MTDVAPSDARTAQPPKRRTPSWVFAVLSVLVPVLICGCVVISGHLLLTTMVYGPNIRACNNAPSMTALECTIWFNTVMYSDEFASCQNEERGNDHPLETALYSCLLREGVGPNQ